MSIVRRKFTLPQTSYCAAKGVYTLVEGEGKPSLTIFPFGANHKYPKDLDRFARECKENAQWVVE
jgi:hypothetical protein